MLLSYDMLLCIVLAIPCYCASFLHACREKIVRNRTRVRTDPTDSRNNNISRYVKKIISHDMHRALHKIFVVYCYYALHTHDTYCMIHACSLYLYVVRFVTCQMVYLTHSWVNIFQVPQHRDGVVWLSWEKVKSSAV